VWRRRVHFLVCRNERPSGAPLTSCARGLGDRLLERLQGRIGRRRLWREVQATGTDCLGACRPEGTTVVVYPEGAWYLLGREEDADALFDAHVLGAPPPGLEGLRLDAAEHR
jgi:(2Fe-2S) ferredoxin